MSSKEEILARIRQNTGTRYEKPDIAAMKRLAYPCLLYTSDAADD